MCTRSGRGPCGGDSLRERESQPCLEAEGSERADVFLGLWHNMEEMCPPEAWLGWNASCRLNLAEVFLRRARAWRLAHTAVPGLSGKRFCFPLNLINIETNEDCTRSTRAESGCV